MDINTEKIYINDVDIAEYGAKALRDSIKVGGTAITNEYFQGRNRTNFTLMSTVYGLKPVSFTLVFIAKYLRDALLYKSTLEASMTGGCEIHLPDGFYYRCMLEKIGDNDIKGVDGTQVLVECAYSFSGIQHDEMEYIEDGSDFLAIGTYPKMDCILTATVSTAASSYTLGGAKFGAVVVGDVLTVDGINKRFLKNGAPITTTEWITFPQVVAGENHITALDPVKVEYYPCYL